MSAWDKSTAAVATRSRYAPLVVVLASLSAGIAADRFAPHSTVVWWVAALLMALAWVALHGVRRERAASCVLCLGVAALGGGWHQAWWQLYPDDEIAGSIGFVPAPAVVEALACYAPRRVPAPPHEPLQAVQTEERSRFEVRITAVRDGPTWRAASGRALVLIRGRLPGVQSGDRLRIVGAISRAAPPANPGDPDFESFARADRRLAFLQVSLPRCVTVVERGPRWTVRRSLDFLRQRGDEMLWRHIAPQRAGLAAALLLGAREQLDEQRTTAFLHTNTIHILAISGMHVAILAACLFYALRLGITSRRTTLIAVAAATVLYTVLTDSPPSAVRAMILVLLVCLAMNSGRPAVAFNVWAAGGIIVLALNPADLFRAGPQLSFLAVAAIIWFGSRWAAWREQDALQRLIQQTRPWPVRAWRAVVWELWRATLLTVVVWLVTMPLIMARFHVLSPAAIVLTTLLTVPVSVALMSGFATMILGGMTPLGAVCGDVCDRSLWILDECVTSASRLPASHFWVVGPSPWWLLGFYLGMASLLLAPQGTWRRYAPLLGILVAIGLARPMGHETDRLQCTFVSVGHGASVILRTPQRQTILYDAGRLGSPAAGARSISGALWSAGIRRLDAVVISHADIDHYNALPALLKQFSVDTIYVSPQMFRQDAEPLRVLKAAIENSGAALRRLSVGDRLQFGSATFSVLHPPLRGVPGSDNAQSIVLAVECEGRRVLLPGDLESPGTEALLAQPAVDCDVLLAPHHGSLRSSPPGFTAFSRPEWVVISGGHANDANDEVANAYRSVGATVFHTAHDGAVRFELDAEGIHPSHWQNRRWETWEPLRRQASR